ncbi:unnamed protein product [Rotaria sordida]|uniref:PDZ domain-containing protein n=1 Tax=Rotaria sordida TaxID=392033 RepID=A0A818YBS4_9BILA|nr:unnamed protein product [Rotaria sordida]CAF0879273.1 unnamed protein product [Rotaria sordida]CAF0889020.1 unnamed protein product [Rotaria sordida]CAF3752336.1 unnamed protein product [Rotaria sordida]CAF3825785.1 unnamed protein product [Rotaria sordida]
MPLFSYKRKSNKKTEISGSIPSSNSAETTTTANASSLTRATPFKESSKPYSSNGHSPTTTKSSNNDKHHNPTKLVFHCQLAHGSPTGLISGFNNPKELYQKIADCFEIQASTILFCTLNTHKVDMSKLLGGKIGLDDFIFAHVKGQAKEIEVIKSEAALGLTITDNGAGYSFVKRIKEGSTVDRLKDLVKIGDHIEKINDKSFVGTRHFQVAKMLKDIPIGSKFTLRLVEANAFGFQVEAQKRGRKTSNIKNGRKTLRFKADGRAIIEDVDDIMVKAIDRINGLLETYMGIHDSDLAQQIWDLSENKKNPSDFAMAIDESEIGTFNFTDEFIFDLWAAIDDIKAGRVPEENDIENERL